MDPLTATLLLISAVTGTVAGGMLLRSLVKILSAATEQPPALPPPPDDDDACDVPPPPTEPDPGDDEGDDEDDSPHDEPETYEQKLSRAINMLTSLIPFAKRKMFVGYRKVDERAIGKQEVEGEIPEAGYTIRQIQGLHEIDYLLADEHALDDDLFFLRLAQGESLVSIPLEVQVVTEPVHEEVWEDTVKVVYLLLDGSGSMEKAWRIPIWKGVATRIIVEARANGAVMMMRIFTGTPGRMYRAETYEEYEALLRFVQSFHPNGGTHIESALDIATNDMMEEGFDDAQLVILTDGEDDRLDAARVRHRLDHHKVSLHAIMLGVDNYGLRACADVYQTVTSDLRVRAPVRRAS